jgi:hypothetical protein
MNKKALIVAAKKVLVGFDFESEKFDLAGRHSERDDY